MKQKVFLIFFLLAFGLQLSCDSESSDSTDTSDTSTGPQTTLHIFLLLGQSNMVGYPEPADEDMVEDERVMVLGYNLCAATGRKQDVWDIAQPPLHSCSEGLGPGDWFAKTLIEHLPAGDTIGLVPQAVNGQALADFSKGTTRYDRIIERAQLAINEGGVISGILFHQGETDNGSNLWPKNVATLVSDLKTDLGLEEDIPFLAGEMLYTGSCAGHNEQIARLPDMIPNAHVISAEGLGVDPTDTDWELHFGREAQVEFGKRYAATMITAMGL